MKYFCLRLADTVGIEIEICMEFTSFIDKNHQLTKQVEEQLLWV